VDQPEALLGEREGDLAVSGDLVQPSQTFSFAPYRNIVSPQLCMYSVDAGKVLTFPSFRGTNASPAWSPDGTRLMFSSSMLGNPELFVSDSSGGSPKRLTFSNGASTSPAWNPKTGNSVVFVSDRGGIPKLYQMNADGTNSGELDVPDKGYLIDPAWAPNGQLLAFSWRRPEGNYDIYIMDVATRQIVEITRDSGRNEPEHRAQRPGPARHAACGSFDRRCPIL